MAFSHTLVRTVQSARWVRSALECHMRMCYAATELVRLYRARQLCSRHAGRTAPPVSPMQDGAAAALNAESCVSSRPHVTADVTVAAGCQAAYAGTRRSHTHRSQPAAVRTRPSAGTRT